MGKRINIKGQRFGNLIVIEELEERVQNTYGFDILDHSVKFFGICSECKNKKEK